MTTGSDLHEPAALAFSSLWLAFWAVQVFVLLRQRPGWTREFILCGEAALALLVIRLALM